MARVGLLGGTFNPPHLAHLVCAQEALVQLGLDRVLLVPAGVPPHKEVEADPGVEHRVAMCEAAVAGDDRLGVSRADAERSGPAYTVELLRALRAAAPGDELSFIVGGDMAHSLPDLARAGGSCSRSRGSRSPSARACGAPTSPSGSPGSRGAPERIDFFDMPRLDISSSLLRRRAAAGGPLRYLVPDAVAAYIAREGLYTGRNRLGRRPPILGGHRMTEPDAAAPPRTTPSDPAGLARQIAEYAADKKAIDIAELDLRGVLGYTDFFVVCSGNTDRQTKAIHDGIHQGLKKEHGLLPRRVEGLGEARWILMDYLDVIVHVFTPEAREFYRLEQLWGEAPRRAVAE